MQSSWYAYSQTRSSVDPKIPFMNTAIPKNVVGGEARVFKTRPQGDLGSFFKKIKDGSYNNTNINKLSPALLAIH